MTASENDNEGKQCLQEEKDTKQFWRNDGSQTLKNAVKYSNV